MYYISSNIKIKNKLHEFKMIHSCLHYYCLIGDAFLNNREGIGIKIDK